MKSILKCIEQYKKDFIGTVVCVLIETICELLLIITTGRFIDALSADTEVKTLILYGVVMLAFTIAIFAFGALAGWLSVVASAGLAKNLRNTMFEKIQSFSFENIDHFSMDSLVTRMTTDVANVQRVVMMIIRTVAKAPVTLICALVMAFLINWQVGVVYICVIPVLGAALIYIAHVTHPIFKRVFKTYDKLNLIVRENLHGIRVVKSFVREEYETKKFHNVSDTIQKDFTKAEKILAFNSPMMQCAIYICTLLIAWLSAEAIVNSGNGTIAAAISMTRAICKTCLPTP